MAGVALLSHIGNNVTLYATYYFDVIEIAAFCVRCHVATTRVYAPAPAMLYASALLPLRAAATAGDDAGVDCCCCRFFQPLLHAISQAYRRLRPPDSRQMLSRRHEAAFATAIAIQRPPLRGPPISPDATLIYVTPSVADAACRLIAFYDGLHAAATPQRCGFMLPRCCR